MNDSIDPKERPAQPNEEAEEAAKTKQQQSDPNITELKGFVDPDEDLEPKGTDNPIKDTLTGF